MWIWKREASRIGPEAFILWVHSAVFQKLRLIGGKSEVHVYLFFVYFQFIPFSLKSSTQFSCPPLVSHLCCIVCIHQIHHMYMEILFVKNDVHYKSMNFRKKLWCWFFYVFIKIFSHLLSACVGSQNLSCGLLYARHCRVLELSEYRIEVI